MAKTKLQPLTQQASGFGLLEHKYNQFSVIVPSTLKKEDLTQKELWLHLAGSLTEAGEIRCLADDNSFVAYLIVLHINKPDVLVKLLSYHELEVVKRSSIDADEDYMIKRSPGKGGFYIQHKVTGDKISEGLPSQSAAFKALEDHKRALAA